MAKKLIRPGTKGVSVKKSSKKGFSVSLDEMMDSDDLAAIGALSALSSIAQEGWNVRKVPLWDGYDVEASIPGSPLVEMNSVKLFASLVAIAAKAIPAARENLKLYPNRHNKGSLMAEFAKLYPGVTNPSQISNLNIVEHATLCLMRAQGWNHVVSKGLWTTPVWLFPAKTYSSETIFMMIAEEYQEIAPKEISAAPDPVPAAGVTAFAAMQEMEHKMKPIKEGMKSAMKQMGLDIDESADLITASLTDAMKEMAAYPAGMSNEKLTKLEVEIEGEGTLVHPQSISPDPVEPIEPVDEFILEPDILDLM